MSMNLSAISTATCSNLVNQTEPDWYESLWQASKEGHLNKVQSITSHFRIENFPKHFGQCFIIAAEKGRAF
ncbi:MAG: hypothetical protein LBC45_05735 [Chlamydiales bacterium]|jgi:hypothetical protein|nr:hypothetical protein [Chlamydiales bacterium]